MTDQMLARLRRSAKQFAFIPRLMAMLWRSGPALAIGWAALSVASGFAPTVRLILVKPVVDRLPLLAEGGPQQLPAVMPWALLWAGAAMSARLLWRATRLVEDHLRERAVLEAQREVLELAATTPLEAMEEPSYYDRLQRATAATQGQMVHLLRGTVSVFQTALQLCSITALLAVRSSWLVILLVGSALPVAANRAAAGFRRWQLNKKQTPGQRKMTYLMNLLTDTRAAKEIRVFEAGEYLQEQWSDIADAHLEERRRLETRYAITGIAGDALNVIAYLVALVLLAYMASRGRYTVGDFAMLSGAVVEAQAALHTLFTAVLRLQNDLIYTRDLSDFLVETRQESSGQLQVQADNAFSVQLENCYFTYPGSTEPSLIDINLSIGRGERVALVGLNGSGKTTLAKVMLGLYRPTAGVVRYNGIPLAHFDVEHLRKQQSTVFQDYARYHFTIGENIALGSLDRMDDSEAIRRAAVMGGIDEVADRLTDGYNTRLGRIFEGIDLSEGQWQRLAASRAFMRHGQAAILVFDEPTSALDPLAEAEVYRCYSELVEGTTAVFITHRLGAVRLADRIIVMDGGRVVEEGTHQELIDQDGIYAALFRTQAEWYQTDLDTTGT